MCGARKKLDEKLEAAGVGPEFHGGAQTVFGELVANAFDHGLKGLDEGVVTVRIELNDAFFSVDVEDPGPGFDAAGTLAKVKRESVSRQRRRGIMQVAGIADLTYTPKGNRVKAVLYRKAEGTGVFRHRRDGIEFIEIRGKGDLALAEEFRRFVETYEVQRPARVCLMVRTEWVSSMFVAAIAELNALLAEHGSVLGVWVEHQGCYRIMEQLGITAFVGVYTSLSEAQLNLRYADIADEAYEQTLGAAGTAEPPGGGEETDTPGTARRRKRTKKRRRGFLAWLFGRR